MTGDRDDRDLLTPPKVAQVDELPLFAPGDWPERAPVKHAEQRSLSVPDSLDEQFDDWRADRGGDAIIARILQRAQQMKAAGATRIGVKMICERERYEKFAHIDNKLISRIARRLIDLDPTLKDLIQLRQLDSAEGISA